MCGICGIISPRQAEPEAAAQVRRMSQLIAHRGPDGEGFRDMPQGTLGHRRLAIIDVAGGGQPMSGEDGAVTVVYNGEIYNFAELRRDLVSHGHTFRTRSDTEVLIHGYEQWGEDMLPRLRGMFAFALWDAPRQELFVARDRLGIKPFYYWYDAPANALTFASEIKALFANPSVPREPNEPRLAEYLLFRYVSGEETLFRDVRELAPGTYGVLSDNGFAVRQYWEPSASRRSLTLNGAVEEGRALLEDAVRSHLVSDVGVGTITSGGLDSSLVSALAAAALPASIDTFCMGFEDPALDERSFARQVAQRIGSRHHDTALSAEGFAASLDRLTWMHDEPLSHPNAIAMHEVFRLARQDWGIPVLLSGEGADEVFGGYGWYRAAWKRDRLRGLFGEKLTRAALHRMARGGARDVADPDYFLFANALGRAPEVLTLPGMADVLERRRAAYGDLGRTVEGLFRYDQLTYLQPLLQRQDRMSMAVGLEARVPFLDHPLVEWGNALDARTKLGRGHPKRLLRRIARGTLADEIIDRQKVGFALPLETWLRGPLRERLSGVASDDGPAARLIAPNQLQDLLKRHGAGDTKLAALLWTLLALDAWHQSFFGASTGTFESSTASPPARAAD